MRVVGAPASYHAKRAELSLADAAGRPWQFALLALTAAGGATWVLRESDFYLQQHSSVAGAILAGDGELQWNEPLLSDEVEERALLRSGELTLRALLRTRDSPATPLAPVLSAWFFARGEASSQPGQARITDVALDGSLVRVDLQNAMLVKASVWLDSESHTVERAVEADRSVFPR